MNEPERAGETASVDARPLSGPAAPPESLARFMAGNPFPGSWDAWLQTVSHYLYQQGIESNWTTFFDVAVRDASLHLEARVRELCDAPADLVGVDLMEHAFKTEGGFLTDQARPVAERDGLRFLFRGFVQAIRNPVGHRKTNLSQNDAFGAISVVAYLIERAEEAAREKYVFPFVTRNDRARGIGLTRLVDIDGDGISEFLVLVREAHESGPRSRLVVTKGNPPRAIPAQIPLLTGGLIHGLSADHDLDGDGLPEVLIWSVQSSLSGSHEFRGMVLDFNGERLVPIPRSNGTHEISSLGAEFEVVQLAELGGATAIAWYDGTPRVPQFWVVDDGTLIRAESPPQA